MVADGTDESLWWITRSLRLPDDRRNGWVIAWIVESQFKEDMVAQASGKEPFHARMTSAGLSSLLTNDDGPRKRVEIVARASEQRELLLSELGQRRKIEAISNSYKSCCSALRG